MNASIGAPNVCLYSAARAPEHERARLEELDTSRNHGEARAGGAGHGGIVKRAIVPLSALHPMDPSDLPVAVLRYQMGMIGG